MNEKVTEKKVTNKKKTGIILMLLGLLLIVAALALFLYNQIEDARAGKEAIRIVEKLQTSQDAEIVSENITEHGEGSEADGEVPDYILNPDMELPEIVIEGVQYIGTLEIPSLELVLPVISEWSYPMLKKAPCRYKGSPYLGNLIIAAHNYDSHFGRLKNLNFEDEIIFTDINGNSFYYEVQEIETLQKTDVERMEAGDWNLTLFTCTIGGQTRVTVRCREVENSSGYNTY